MDPWGAWHPWFVMPSIVIKKDPNINSTKLVMLEFQGRIESDLPSKSGMVVGQLDMQGCTLQIGNQKLKGKRVKLAKPFAVTRKDKDGASLVIQNIITEKIIFDSRPMTMMK